MAGTSTLRQRLHRLERDHTGGEVIHVCYAELAGESLRGGYVAGTDLAAFELRQRPDGTWQRRNQNPEVTW